MSLDDDYDIDIDALIAEVEEDKKNLPIITEAVSEETPEVPAVVEENLPMIDLDDKDALSNKIVETSLNVIGFAQDVFKSFSDDVFKGRDRSTSSKEAMLRALDIQNGANKNMIDLAKVINSKDKSGTNILINTVSEKSAGISLSNMKDNL